jgi:hypothetical protein
MGYAEPTDRRRRRLVFVLVAVGIIGVTARLWLWWSSVGTLDVVRWMHFGQAIHDHGLADTYASLEKFNHPPLMGLYAAGVWDLTGENLWNFARLLKLPALVGEAIALIVLTRLMGVRALAAYATAPAAVLVSSYHGNTDPLYAILLLLSALAFDRQQFLWAGLLFGAALNIKILPIALLPLLVIAAPHVRGAVRLCGGLAIAALPYIPLLVTSGGEMYRNMLAYDSVQGSWGLLALLNPASDQRNLTEFVTPLRDAFISHGRYLIIGAVVLLALASRLSLRLRMTEQFALGGALFLLLAPGFGVQYVVLIAPLLIVVSLRYSLAWYWLAGAFIGILYWITLVSTSPLQSGRGIYGHDLPDPATQIGLVAWALLAVFTWRQIAQARRTSGERYLPDPRIQGREPAVVDQGSTNSQFGVSETENRPNTALGWPTRKSG